LSRRRTQYYFFLFKKLPFVHATFSVNENVNHRAEIVEPSLYSLSAAWHKVSHWHSEAD